MRAKRDLPGVGAASLSLALIALSLARPGSRDDSDPTGHDRAWEILDHLGEGVLLVDEALRPVLANAAARRLLGFRKGPLPPRVPSEEILRLAGECLDQQVEKEATLDLWFPARSTLSVRAVPMDTGGAIVALRDVTEELLAQRVRKEFVAHASHELKSPVASLQALAEAIGQAVGDDPQAAAKFAERLATESERLGRLISDLLDLSRLEDPMQTPDIPVDLSALARSEVESCRPDAQAKDIALEADLEDDVWVRGDEQQLRLLVRNLLDNAIRYTQERGNVEISVKRWDDKGEIRVSDDGIGIAREAQGRIFERFYRVDRARSRDRGGTGLGLAIVKHVAELHGGNVSVTSALGEGSHFVAHLPLMERQGDTAQAPGD
jgi:signal transduction histidine kinase